MANYNITYYTKQILVWIDIKSYDSDESTPSGCSCVKKGVEMNISGHLVYIKELHRGLINCNKTVNKQFANIVWTKKVHFCEMK